MEEDTELKAGGIYIFKREWPHHADPFKGKILEVTEKTVLVENLDNGYKTRYTVKDFKEEWEVIETMFEDDIDFVVPKQDGPKRLVLDWTKDGLKQIKEDGKN